jgi:hypothetical protein
MKLPGRVLKKPFNLHEKALETLGLKKIVSSSTVSVKSFV